MRVSTIQRFKNLCLAYQCHCSGVGLGLSLIVVSLFLSLPCNCQDRRAPSDPHPSSQPTVVRFAWPKGFTVQLAPIISGSRVVGVRSDGGILAISSETGAVLWEKKLKLALTPSPSYLLDENTLYLPSPGRRILAISLNKGDTRAFNSESQQIRLLAVDRRALYLYDTEAATLRAIRLKDGIVLWQAAIGPNLRFTDGSPAKLSGENLLVVLHNADAQGRRIAGQLVCYDAATGRKEWSFNSNRVWDAPIEASATNVFLVADKRVAVGPGMIPKGVQPGDDVRAALFALDMKSGKPVWDSQLVSHSPVYMGAKWQDGVLFYEDASFTLRAYSWQQKKLLWESTTDCSKGDVVGSNGFAISQGTILWAPCGKIVGLAQASGNTKWTLNSPGTITEAVIQNGKAIYGLPDGILVISAF